MISVIMLTYNREEFVGRAIESILAQTYKNFEFIVVDNGATDRRARSQMNTPQRTAVCG